MKFRRLLEDAPVLWVDPDFAEAMADPLQMKIIGELTLRPMSAKLFSEAFPDYTYSMVQKAFRKLLALDCIERVDAKTGGDRRGGVEQFYRPTRRAIFNHETWAKLPLAIRQPATAMTFQNFFGRVSDAIEQGTMDARTERHASWSPLQLDEKGWEDLISDCAALFGLAQKRQAEASNRLAESGGRSFPVTFGLACFESPEHHVFRRKS